MSLIVASGTEYNFRCRHPNSDGIIWRIDGVSVANLPERQRNFVEEQNSGQTLIVTADLLFNNMTTITIRCVAVFINEPSIPACPITLRIQGLSSI